MKKSDRNLKVLLIILIIMIIMLSLITIINKDMVINQNNPLEVNVSSNGELENINYDDFEIIDSSFDIDTENNNTKVNLTIKNNSKNDKYLKSFNIVIKNKNGEKIDKFYVLANKKFQSNEEYTTVTGTDKILKDIAKVEFIFDD